MSLKRRGSRTSIISSLAHAIGPSSVGLSAVGAPLMAGEVEEMAPPMSPHEALSEDNPQWMSVQHSLIALFQGKLPTAEEMTFMAARIREMVDSDVGPFIYDYYKASLLTRGMQILFFKLDTTSKDNLVESLERTWLTFYTEILPVIQILMKPVMTPTILMNCRRTAVVAFRDKVVLKCDLGPILRQKDYDPPPVFKQMLLVLQYARDGDPPSENYLALERLVSLAVSPLLGYMGLYEGKGKLTVPADHHQLQATATESRQRNNSASGVPLPRYVTQLSAPVPIPAGSTMHRRQVSTSSSIAGLETVAEDDPPARPPRGLAAAAGLGANGRRRHTLNDTVIRGQLLKSPLLAQHLDQ